MQYQIFRAPNGVRYTAASTKPGNQNTPTLPTWPSGWELPIPPIFQEERKETENPSGTSSTANKSNNYLVFAGIGVAILALFFVLKKVF